ncbi:hypothetical protein F5878DRAFT_645902, partial [Lentinula raphanica]
MDHSQWLQQSLQTVLANNPQLFLQLLQHNQTQSAPSNAPAFSPPFPQLPAVSSNSAPLSASHAAPVPSELSAPASVPSSVAPAPVPLSAAPTPVPLSAAPTPVPLSAAPTPVPLSAAPAPAPPNLNFPLALANLLPSTMNPNILQSQAVQPVSTYISPLSMLSSVTTRNQDTVPSHSFLTSSSSSSSSSSSLPPSITTIQQANRNRLGHASSTLGHTTTTTKRKRGPGKKAPRLYGAAEQPKIEDAVATANDGTQVVSLVVLVYPPRLTPEECNTHGLNFELHHYLQNRDAFQHVLRSIGLLYEFDNLPLDTKVVELLEALHSSLVQNGWIFPENHEASSFFNRHERLAIQLLRFSGKGNINNNAKTPRLSPGKVESENMTLRDIVFNSDHYGVAKFVITNAKKFVLHTIIRSPNVSYMVNLAEKGLGSDNTISRHFCLSKRIYGIFRSDTNAFVDEGYSALDEDEIELGCNRNDPGSDDDE